MALQYLLKTINNQEADESGNINISGGTGDLYSQITGLTEVDLATLTGDETLVIAQSGTTSAYQIKLADLARLFDSNPFSNGIEFVTTSRDFQSSDEDKLLVVGNDSEEVILTMPEENIWQGGRLSLTFITNGGFNVTYGAPIVYPMSKQTAGNELDSNAQFFSFITYGADDAGAGGIVEIGATDGVVVDYEDGNKSKTTIKYLMDKVSTLFTDIQILTNIEEDSWGHWQDRYLNGSLPIAKDIIITNRADKGIRLKTNKFGNGFELQGSGGYLNCDYDNYGFDVGNLDIYPNYSGVTNYSNTPPALNWGQWTKEKTSGVITYDSLVGGTFNVGDLFYGNSGSIGRIFDIVDNVISFYMDNFGYNFVEGETIDNYSGVTANIVNVINPELEFIVGNIYFWNNKHYQLISKENINGDNPENNLNYFPLEKTYDSVGYNVVWDTIEYDFANDILISRRSKENCYLVNSFDEFPWGDPYVSIQMPFHNYLNIINNSGTIIGVINGDNSGINIIENQGTIFFDVSGKYQNIYLNKNSCDNVQIHLTGFNNGIDATGMNGDDKIFYLNGNSLVTANNTSGYIKGDYYDGVVVNHQNHAGEIRDAVFAKGSYTVSLDSNYYHRNCEYTNSRGNFTAPRNLNFEGEEISNNGSSFYETIDLSGVTDVITCSNEMFGILKLTNTDSLSAVTFSEVANVSDLFPIKIINIAPTWEMTIQSQSIDSVAGNQICLEGNLNVILTGNYDEEFCDYLIIQSSKANKIKRQIGGSIL